MVSTWAQELSEFRNQQIKIIIDAAEKVFLSRGTLDANMTEIAAEAGISRPTLYKYFSTIDELALEVQMRSLDKLNDEIRLYTAGKLGNALEKIHMVFEACLAFYDRYPQYVHFTTLFDQYFQSTYNTPQNEERYTGFLQQFSEMEKLIKKGQAEGVIRYELDAHDTSAMIENTMLAMFQRMASRGEILSREQHIQPRVILEKLFEMMLDSLKEDPEAAASVL